MENPIRLRYFTFGLRHTRRVISRSIGALCAAVSVLMPTSAFAEEPIELTVMSRNLYLGADVGIAMDLLPDFPAATQFMWDQVAATDFATRADALAIEVANNEPEVIGLQEAAKWVCTTSFFDEPIAVFDFTNMFIEALKERGVSYELASKDGNSAYNPGFEISPIPYLTIAHDENIFPSLFGKKDAACGFEIADALLVRSDLTDDIIQVGTVEFDKTYPVIPTIMTIYRGYAWADININNTPTRFITTHLESMWDTGEVPAAKIQANELVQDLAATKMPLIVMGDFNSDPRDPRSASANPGGQPEVSETCPAKPQDATCNAYWTMSEAGFMDAGPDATNPLNFSWGTNALLTGPDEQRIASANEMGNPYGFTDRLDYVFTKNGATATEAHIVDNSWPTGKTNWQCGNQECFPSDHAGLVVTLTIPASDARDLALDPNNRFPIGIWDGVVIAILGLVTWRVIRRVRKR